MTTVELAVINQTSFEDLFIIVQWPDVQELMEYSWFRQECILYQAFEDQPHLDSAYFVPLNRMVEHTAGDMTNRMAEQE